jgi:hypothetical protein
MPLLLLILLSLSSMSSWAKEVGKVTHLSGLLTVERAGIATKILSVQSAVLEGDLLRTEEDTYARIKFNDNSEVVLRPETSFKINEMRFQESSGTANKSDMELIKGGMRAVTGLIGKNNPDAVKVATPTATIGIRGTHFGLLFCQDSCANVANPNGVVPENGLHADVVSGAISVTNGAGTVDLSAGQFGYVPSPNAMPQLVPPSQGVQVTMPPSIRQNEAPSAAIGKGKESQCAIQ